MCPLLHDFFCFLGPDFFGREIDVRSTQVVDRAREFKFKSHDLKDNRVFKFHPKTYLYL